MSVTKHKLIQAVLTLHVINIWINGLYWTLNGTRTGGLGPRMTPEPGSPLAIHWGPGTPTRYLMVLEAGVSEAPEAGRSHLWHRMSFMNTAAVLWIWLPKFSLSTLTTDEKVSLEQTIQWQKRFTLAHRPYIISGHRWICWNNDSTWTCAKFSASAPLLTACGSHLQFRYFIQNHFCSCIVFIYLFTVHWAQFDIIK